MKKIFTLIVLSVLALSVNATDLFTGSQYVTWGQGLQIAKEKFADAKPGDKIVVTYTGASDGIEFKVLDDFHRLPGSLQWCPISGNSSLETFLTNAAVSELKAAGLEMIGNNFTVTKVELLEGKDNVTENTVWTGYFWVDGTDWKTIEIAYTSFAGVNWDKVEAIRFYSEKNTVKTVLINWETEGKIADENSGMKYQDGYTTLSLNDNMRNILKSLDGTNDHDRLMVQCAKGDGDAFNFTAIELVPVNTAIETTTVEKAEKVQKSLQNGRVVITKGGVKYNAVGQKL